MSKIEQLIGEIEEFIDGCKLQPFSSTKIVVDKAQLEDLLVELRHRTPDEIKKYQKILNNKDAIINDAKQQAEAIISAANVQTSEMVNQSEITKRAYARANEIITQATQQANEIVNKAIEDANALRTGAIAYTDDMMGSMEQTLAQGLDGLKEKYEEMLSTMNTTVETIRANRKELPKADHKQCAGIKGNFCICLSEFITDSQTAVFCPEAVTIQRIFEALKSQIADLSSYRKERNIFSKLLFFFENRSILNQAHIIIFICQNNLYIL